MEYFTDNWGGFRIRDKPVLIFRGFQVSVWRECTDKLSLPLFCFQRCVDFLRYVLRIQVVYKVFEGDDQFIPILVFFAVVVVIDRYKPYPKVGEYFFQVIAGLDRKSVV